MDTVQRHYLAEDPTHRNKSYRYGQCVFGEGTTTKDVLNDHEWIWESGVLYLRNDAGTPNGGIFEAGQRLYAIKTNQNNYLIIDGIDTYGAQMGHVQGDATGNIPVNQSDHVILRNFDSSRAYNQAIYVLGSSNVTIDNCTFHDVREFYLNNHLSNAGGAIYVTFSPDYSAQSSNVTITNNHFTGYIDRWNITLSDVIGALVQGNTFNSITDIGSDIELDWATHRVRNVVIDGNTFNDHGTGKIAGATSDISMNVNQFGTGRIDNITISNNSFDSQKGGTINSHGAPGIDISGNTMTNTTMAFYGDTSATVTFRNNYVSINPGGTGIWFSGNPGVLNCDYNIFEGGEIGVRSGSNVTSNVLTIYLLRAWVITTSENATVKNNLFTTGDTFISNAGTITSDHNVTSYDSRYMFYEGRIIITIFLDGNLPFPETCIP